MKELWVEQYRPKSIDGYVFRDESQREQIKGWIDSGSIPHILLSGSAGLGKTTIAKILINQLCKLDFICIGISISEQYNKFQFRFFIFSNSINSLI